MLGRLQQAVDAERREKAEVVAELTGTAQRNAELVARVEVSVVVWGAHVLRLAYNRL